MRKIAIMMLSLLAITVMITPESVIGQSDKIAIVETKSGNFMIEFFPNVAPKHVDNFITLANDGYYDGTVFHRVIKGFMIQGGDPNTKDPEKIQLWGSGGPGYSVNAEFNDKTHERGIVSMARSQDPNSAGSQFFIVHGDASFLDGQYTVFGKIVGDESFSTLDKIANMETVSGDRPVNWRDTEIVSITLEDNDVPLIQSDSDDKMMDEKNGDGGGCLVATAAFGSEMAPQVQNLREIRDNVVLNTESGRTFMAGFNQLYYSFSPAIADLEREDPAIRKVVRATITPMLASLSIFDNVTINSEVDMLGYGILVILTNIVMYAGVPFIALYMIRKQLSCIKQNKKHIAV